jgi:hypothetical protein
LKETEPARQNDKLVRFVWLHLGDGKGQDGAREIDKSCAGAIKILMRYDHVDEGASAHALAADESMLALLYFHLTFV